ncbi:MAG TPA: hypothetical protein VM534_03530, partial [Thermoanaerobaculia bacterium]|nr:hypothetical protein [Thermoanaerobaculia bacterium]
ARRGSLVTLAALAFAPTWILWCSQPLKDAVFMFLVVLLLWCLSIWQRWSGAERPFDRIRMDLAVAFLWVAIGMVAAIRWYFGVFLFGSAGLLMLLVALRRGWRDWRLSLTPIPILWIASWLVVLGAGAYMAPQVRSAMTLGLIGDVEIEVVSQLDARRRGFDSTVGKTAIRPTMLADEIGTTSLGLASERKEQLATEYRKALREARENPGGPVPRKSRELREALDHFHQQADRYAREAVVRSHRERWITTITHAVILVLPRAVVTGIGLAEIGGGRGLWLFAELDTLYFDAFLLIVLIMSYQAGRGVLRDPMWITLMVTTMMVWIPLAYVVTNYGTLFRLRELVFVLIALIPLAADRVRETADQDQRGEL